MASRRVSSLAEAFRTRAVLAFTSALLTLPLAPLAHAQDNSRLPSLDELIPDSAVDDPEGWAGDDSAAETADVPQVIPDENTGDTVLETLDIPSSDEIALDDDPGEPSGENVDFAALEDLTVPDARTTNDVVRVDDRLLIGFPDDKDGFPEKFDFITRFEALSTIEQLDGGGGNIAQLGAQARADQELLQRLVRSYGYYGAQVTRSIGGVSPGEAVADTQPVVRFDILPGERYRFGSIDLGALTSAPDHASLRAAFAIETGDPLSSDRIVAQRFALDSALGESGYPFAAIADPTLLIDHDRLEGDLTMPVEPGGKYVFGEVTSSLPRFLSSKHLQTIARFDTGETYQRSMEADLRRAIIATGLVSTVTIAKREVQTPEGDAPGEIALDVTMEKAKLRTIAGAVGYGSEDGVKLEASWEHRNLFPPEGALSLRGIVGTREQLVGVGFKRNNWRRRDQIITLDAYASDITSESVEARTVAVRAAFERLSNLLFQKELSWTVGAEVLLTDERNRIVGGIARPRQTYRVGSLFGRIALDESDDLLDPTEGYRVSLFAAPEVSHTQGATATYLRSQVDASYYQTVSDGVVLAGRFRGATIQGAEIFQIAPSRRLYAGGGSSVRGYGYQAVGPRNDFGEATGGRSLVELSAEARIDTGFFDGALQVVPFFDLGAVSIDTTPDFRFVKYGAGLGVRYKTGFGPIRFDLGVPLNRDPLFDSRFAVYVSLGQAF